LSPFFAAAPSPSTRSSTFSCFGAGPLDFGISGFFDRSRSPAVGVIFVAVGAASACVAAAGCVLACCSAVRANRSAALSSALPPQALSRSDSATTAAGILIFVVMVMRVLSPGAPREEGKIAEIRAQGYELKWRSAHDPRQAPGCPPSARSR
jgi:hypothetical protein